MKSVIIYSSLTGNTKMIAETINSVLQGDIFPLSQAPNLENYDLLLLGFWADKGGADTKTVNYFKTIKDKKLAFFFTLGADPKSAYAEKMIKNTEELLRENKVLASFHCQGKIDPKILELSTKYGEMTEERKARIEEAQKHPNEEDLAAAKIFAQEVLKLYEEEKC